MSVGVTVSTQSLSVIPLTEDEERRYKELYRLFFEYDKSYKALSDHLIQNGVTTATDLEFTPKRLFGVLQKVFRHYDRLSHWEVKGFRVF